MRQGRREETLFHEQETTSCKLKAPDHLERQQYRTEAAEMHLSQRWSTGGM